LIVVALAIGAFVYQRVLSKRFKAASKATQETFETTAVNLRKRALGVKEHDDDQRKCELEAKERDELKRFSKFANTKKLRSELQRPQQQQHALKQSVSRVITLGLKDIQTRLLQADFKRMVPAAPHSLRDRYRKPDEAASKIQNRNENLVGKRVPGRKRNDAGNATINTNLHND
jgi:hypothetical protein